MTAAPASTQAPRRWLTRLLRSGVVAMAMLAGAMPAVAQEGDTRRAESLDPAVARDLLGAYEKLQNEDYRAALTDLNRLVERRGDSMKPFDRASVLQIRGSAHVNLDDFPAALRDFEAALQLNALPDAQNLQLRYNIAQLHFQNENYDAAIRHFREWLATADAPSAGAWYMLAAAHYYKEDHASARQPIERAISMAESPDRRYYDLANIIYNELGAAGPRTQLLQAMVEHWPAEQSYWKQLAALHMEQGRERQAFVTLELAYRAGLLDQESDLLTLAQLYSMQNNPHRGAALLEKEFEAGRVQRNVQNLELLSQLLSQAREHARAIPVLQEAARQSDTGMLSYRLGQVLLADEQYAEAEAALVAAIDKGNLNDSARADTWMLLGTARFNQAGSGDRARRMSADEAFAQAERFQAQRRQASQWREYIRAINDTESRQAILEEEQRDALAEAARERELSACRTRQIAGNPLTEACRELLAEEDGPVEEEEEPAGG